MSTPDAPTEETPATDEPTEGTPTTEEAKANTLVDLAVDIGNLVRTVAEVCRMPLGTANSVVKTTLEYHLNKEALNLQREQSGTPIFPRPVALPGSEEDN